MTLDQLQSFTEDEVAMLWGIVNMGNPPVLTGQQMEPSLFPFIKEHKLKDRVIQFDKYVKPEYIEIRDAFIINIGINFEIITLPGANSDEVLLKCILALQDIFNIDNWQINQPINYRNLYVALDQIEGVQTVKSIQIINKVGSNQGYSDYAYDISGATANNVIINKYLNQEDRETNHNNKCVSRKSQISIAS